MSKRFADSEIYKEDWFVALTPGFKLLWDYITRDCDHAGVWRINLLTAKVLMGWDSSIDIEDFIDRCNADKKIRIFRSEDHPNRLWLTGFIPFQYGRKDGSLPENNTVKSALEIVNGLGYDISFMKINEPYTKGIGRVGQPLGKGMARVKDKDRVKVKVLNKRKKEWESNFLKFWEQFDYRVGKEKAERAFHKLKRSEYVELMKYIDDGVMKLYVKNTHKDDTYPSRKHPTTFLNSRSWRDEIPGLHSTTKDGKPKPYIFMCTNCFGTFHTPLPQEGNADCPNCSDYDKEEYYKLTTLDIASAVIIARAEENEKTEQNKPIEDNPKKIREQIDESLATS